MHVDLEARSDSDQWLGVELRHLETLKAVAQEMSFRGAAKRLGFGQSAISQQIALLERRVGARLVDRFRGGKTVGLTPAGRLLLRHAEEILARVALARRDFAVLAHDTEASVRLGVFQSVGARLLPPALARAARARRDLRVQLVPARKPTELLNLLGEGKVDLAFTEEPPADDGLRGLALADDPYVLLVRADDTRIPRSTVSLALLARLPLLTYETCFHLLRVERDLAQEGTLLNPVVRSDDAPTLHGLVVSGVGYALLPRLAIDAADTRFAAIPVDPRIPHRAICLAWHRERNVTPSMKILLAAAKQIADELRTATRAEPEP